MFNTPKWMVYDIVLTTLYLFNIHLSLGSWFTRGSARATVWTAAKEAQPWQETGIWDSNSFFSWDFYGIFMGILWDCMVISWIFMGF
jgi:hypothetical protein